METYLIQGCDRVELDCRHNQWISAIFCPLEANWDYFYDKSKQVDSLFGNKIGLSLLAHNLSCLSFAPCRHLNLTASSLHPNSNALQLFQSTFRFLICGWTVGGGEAKCEVWTYHDIYQLWHFTYFNVLCSLKPCCARCQDSSPPPQGSGPQVWELLM